jgi:hypothetical protein
MSDKEDILSFGKGKGRLPEDKLIAYLEGKLTPAEQHEVEQWLAEEGMESDAIEGLHGQKPEDTKHSVSRLNHNLRKTIFDKKRRRKPLNTNNLAWIAIVIILLLVVLAYIVIRKSI